MSPFPFKFIDPDGNLTSYGYDVAGNQTWMENPLSYAATSTYDADNRLVQTIDPNGNKVSIGYDLLGHETSERLYQGTSTLAEILSYSYDPNGNMLSAATYDGSSSLLSAYDMAYNPLNEMTESVDAFGHTLAYGYDGRGLRTYLADTTSVSSASYGTQWYAYDSAGELVSETLVQSSTTMVSDWKFDWLQRQIQETDWNDTTQTSLAAMYTDSYNALGQLTQLNEVNGLSVSNTIADYLYFFDGIGEMTGEIDYSLSGGSLVSTSTGYVFDKGGQIVTAGATSEAYDANANRSTTSQMSGTGNLLSSVSGSTVYEDQVGNVTQMVDGTTTETLKYDALNRLTFVTFVNTASSSLDYAVSYDYGAIAGLLKEVTTATTTVTTGFVNDIGGATNAALSLAAASASGAAGILGAADIAGTTANGMPALAVLK